MDTEDDTIHKQTESVHIIEKSSSFSLKQLIGIIIIYWIISSEIFYRKITLSLIEEKSLFTTEALVVNIFMLVLLYVILCCLLDFDII